MTNHETQFRRSSMARQSDSWKRIQDERIPFHHLSTAEQKVRKDFDAQFESNWQNPIVRHHCSFNPKYAYTDLIPCTYRGELLLTHKTECPFFWLPLLPTKSGVYKRAWEASR